MADARCAVVTVIVVPGPENVLALRVNGEIDTANAAELEAEFIRLVDGSVDVVVDVHAVTMLSAAGARMLTRVADRLADGGRRMLVVTGAGMPRRVLEAIHAVDVLEVFTTVDTAVAALDHASDRDCDELVRLRDQVRDLREKLRTRPLVARALGMLHERYRLPDVNTANGLLRDVSQRNNVKMRLLAHAFVGATPPPSPDAPRWFPGRLRPPAPRLTFVTRAPANLTVLLDEVLDAVLACSGAEAGDVQLVDPVRGALAIERQRGLPTSLLTFFEEVGTTGSPCAEAWRRRSSMVVADVASDPVYDEDARAVLLDAGIRAVRSTPLLAPSGECVGVVSTHHREVGAVSVGAEPPELARIAAEAGAWIAWYVRNTTLDALEHLHDEARRAARGRAAVTGGVAAPRPRRPRGVTRR
ncbi:STAS domain-containing protein [Actinophytocola gossypii]|uniref:ANTAR domain-containing protein n=1 Tax=Actinophytocola gossypii TaxID=2812003 RepID=A0ABT2J7K5_9PSEU|nr:STAS domain-containing protein [Actinophytocola gossypii]MCT2583480.1 ANTAR domain-containing protein [Actinophytocola gossypii]